MHWGIFLFTLLSTTPIHGVNAQTNENKDEGSSYSPLVAELDTLAVERTGFDPIVQLHLNWTRSGHRGSPTRTLPRSLLEARQATPQCTPSNYVLACPVTEASPCCPPDFLVCCHNGICCPEGTFCSGLQSCCVNGATGCGDSCCPSPLICGTIAGAQTCVDPGSSTVAASITATGSTTILGSGGGSDSTTGGAGVGSSSATLANPSYTPANQGQSTTNVAVIGGAVGGGVGALILIALLAWYLLRQKKVQGVSEPGGPETMATPFTNGQHPPMVAAVTHDSSPAYPEGHAVPIMNKGNHPWSANSSGAISGFPYGGSGALGTSYGHSTSSPPPPGSVFGGIATMSDTGSSGVVGPGGYVPPPPEDIPTTTSPGPGGGSYYGAGPTGYGGAAMTGSSAYSPSQHESLPAAGTTYSSNVNPPWVAGVGSPSEQQQQQQQYSQQRHVPWSGSGVSGPTHDPSSTPWTSGVSHEQPPPPQPQQQLQMHQALPPQPWLDSRLAPSPGPMSPPPPPFSPGPFVPPPQEGASSGGGRVVPMTAIADRKAKPTKTASGTGT